MEVLDQGRGEEKVKLRSNRYIASFPVSDRSGRLIEVGIRIMDICSDRSAVGQGRRYSGNYHHQKCVIGQSIHRYHTPGHCHCTH